MRKTKAILIILLTISLIAPAIPQAQSETDTFTVSQSSDDVYIRVFPVTIILAGTACPCGDFASNNYDYEAGMRWTVDIPQGATIESAYLKLVANSQSGQIPTTIITGEADDNPLTFSTYNDYRNRIRTSEYINWKPTAWTAGTTYTSPDISSIVQTIVNRGGFGNHIVLFWNHTAGWGGAMRLISGASWDHATRNPPKLEVTWSVIGPPSDPDLLFGAGFNATSPYAELHWNHSLVDVQFFEVQNSSDAVTWAYLGQSTTANYTDTQVVNGTERFYRVRACNQTGGTWYNSSWTLENFETVYFIPDTEAPPPGDGAPPVDDYSVIFLAMGLIFCLAIYFLYARNK